MSKIKTAENYLREKHHTEATARTTHDNFYLPTHDSTLPAVKEHPFPKNTKSDWIWLGEGCRRREARQMETDAQVASSPACSMDPPPPPFYSAHPLSRSRPSPARNREGSLLTRRLAQHDVGPRPKELL